MLLQQRICTFNSPELPDAARPVGVPKRFQNNADEDVIFTYSVIYDCARPFQSPAKRGFPTLPTQGPSFETMQIAILRSLIACVRAFPFRCHVTRRIQTAQYTRTSTPDYAAPLHLSLVSVGIKRQRFR